MAFQGHLSNDQLRLLVEAGVRGEVPDIDRRFRLAGIPYLVRSRLQDSSVRLTQFQADLMDLAAISRLPDGQVPIVDHLRNIAFQLRLASHPVEAEIYEKMANLIGNRESGVPPLPQPSALPEVRNEVVVGLDDMVPFDFLSKGSRAGGAVARILVPRFEAGQAVMNGAQPWVMAGTGWLVAPDLLVTNHHVINARTQGEADASAADFLQQGMGAIVEFDFDAVGAVTVKMPVREVMSSSKDLDYAFIRVDPPENRPPLSVSLQRLHVSTAMRPALNIIQHPRGDAKRVAFRNNLATWADQQTIRYFTDTDHGSSGSPVFDDNWRVIAIHRGALRVDNVQYQGKTEAYVNYGSQMIAILDEIKGRDVAFHAKLMDAVALRP